MNNYALANAVELGRASSVILGSKVWLLMWLDTQMIIHMVETWLGDDIDETD